MERILRRQQDKADNIIEKWVRDITGTSQKNMKKCSTSFVVHIKATLRDHYTPSKMAKIPTDISKY